MLCLRCVVSLRGLLGLRCFDLLREKKGKCAKKAPRRPLGGPGGLEHPITYYLHYFGCLRSPIFDPGTGGFTWRVLRKSSSGGCFVENWGCGKAIISWSVCSEPPFCFQNDGFIAIKRGFLRKWHENGLPGASGGLLGARWPQGGRQERAGNQKQRRKKTLEGPGAGQESPSNNFSGSRGPPEGLREAILAGYF